MTSLREFWIRDLRLGVDGVALCILSFVLLWPELRVGLLGDDWVYLLYAKQTAGFSAIEAQTRPIGTISLELLLSTFWKQPAWLGAIRLLHHAVNATAVMFLAR